MKDIKKTRVLSQQEAIAYLTEELDSRTRKRNGFGFGFPRWVTSNEFRLYVIRYKNISMSFDDIRRSLKPLADRGLILRKQQKGSLTKYSTLGWEDCTAINDYFIEK